MHGAIGGSSACYIPPMKLEGGCLCGAVRYEFEGDPAMVFFCHCRDCQQAGGSLFHYGILVPEPALKVQGDLNSYESKADSGRSITRNFCPTCGSGVLNTLEMAPGMAVIKGGSLDETGPKPTFELYTRSKPPWLENAIELRGFEQTATAPPQELFWKP